MTLRKKILFYSLLTLLTLAALEGISRLAYYLAFAEWYFPTQSAPADPAGIAPGEPEGLTRQAPQMPPNLAFMVSHPYYGYTSLFPDSPLNVMPPPQTGPDTIVIGILGGSVAWEVTPYLQQALIRHFADQGLAQDPVVVQLSYGAMKQPQQLHIANFMLAMGGRFDILVNLDGHNELFFSYVNYDKDVFPSFPVYWENLVFVTRDEIALAGQIRAIRARLAQLQQAAPASPFRYTALYGILHRYQTQQAQTRILQLNYELSLQRTARSLEQQGPLTPFQNVSQVHQETVRVWYRSSALLFRLAAAAGADYYHFLQPNQYIPNSKPLSPKEQRDHYLPSALSRTDYANTYPLLQQFGQNLQRQGVHYFDLAQVFHDRPETLYRDSCCHLNRRGYELLAAAMVERMAPTLRHRAAASHPEPDGRLTIAAPISLPPAPSAPSPTLPAAPVTEPHFQVSLRPGNLLVYTKENCLLEHTASPFFLHITPTDTADLPPHRRRHGFASQDFSFPDGGVHDGHWGGNNCVIARPLPEYPIAAIRTGQFNPAGEIWSVQLPNTQ